MRWRLLAVGLLLGVIAAGWWWLGGSVVDFDSLRQLRADLSGAVDRQPVWSAAAFIAAYLLVAALALPGALILTLLGGALFGLGWGVVLVALGSSLGALLSFSLVRLIAGQGLRNRLANRLAAVARGIEQSGGYYLFTLRVVPVFPFFMVNVLVALTPIRVRTFYWVSVVGMLPATFIYVNAGHQLAHLNSLAGLLSPGLVASLLLLGVFPLAARAVLPRLAERVRVAIAVVRSRRRWGTHRPSRFDRDMIVIGGGAAGLVAANIAASLRARVTLIERDAMGGDCLNTGCVPSKALIRLADQIRREREMLNRCIGLQAGTAQRVLPGFNEVMARVREVIDRIAPHDSVERYESLGVECIQGDARALSPWTIEVLAGGTGAARRLSARHLIIATGAEPVVPDIAGLDPARVVTSATVWALPELPARLLVLGGGAVGCELAQAFQRLGSRVTLLERASRLLPREEPEASAQVRAALEREGVQVLIDAQVTGVHDGHRAQVKAKGLQLEIEFDRMLCALGRRARIEGAGLEALGLVREADGTLQVDDWMRTSEPNVFACGDVATTDRLTHVAGNMGWLASVNALFGVVWPIRIDRRVVPRCVFTDPEVARVGMTREEAERAGLRVDCTRYAFASLDRAIIEERTQGDVSVLTESGTDRLIGVTVVGARAGDLISVFSLAMRERIGLRRLMSTMVAYPGWADAGRAVAAQWQRERAPQAVLKWLERWHRWRRG
jgi:pyruvate/2-oxoglutarate dehydrogenase complex dihydrolipoamide dehydrogenase (E3) component/uncharacterized membrane protein YdjX (TVP38/TMEM64 family)